MEAPSLKINDRRIRESFHATFLRSHHLNPEALVLDEMGVRNSECRVDIAVIDDRLMRGYEIKSDVDSLARLPKQIAVYSEVFDLMFLVVGEKHREKAVALIPDWWGTIIATPNLFGCDFRLERNPKINPCIHGAHLAEMILKTEVVAGLRSVKVPNREFADCDKRWCCKLLAERMALDDLRAHVRKALITRHRFWRVTVPNMNRPVAVTTTGN